MSGISVASIIMFLCFIPAIVVHEVAHGFIANRLGDPTAKAQGRITLNPLKHVDPFGTVILPLVLMFTGMPVFGYAKPVPYNPRYFKNIRTGEFLTGIAGPLSNVGMALIGIIIAYVTPLLTQVNTAYIGYNLSSVQAAGFAVSAGDWIVFVCYLFVMVNLCLAFFNIIPLPPLDGSSIIALFLTDKALRQYYRIQRYALPILMVLLFIVPWVLHFNPISIYIDATAGNLTRLAFGL